MGVSYIEMDAEKISAEELLEAERLCNEAVRDAVDVRVKTFEASDPELDKVRAIFSLYKVFQQLDKSLLELLNEQHGSNL